MKKVLVCSCMLPILLIVFRINLLPPKSTTKNVCKSISDYATDKDTNENCYHSSEYKLTVPEIIQYRGYPIGIFNVTTADGYVLSVFRIPNETGRPVFLQHGSGSNSASFVMIGKKSLAFVLADAGYDVWLGNFRGTMYSNHVSLNRSDPEFWNYSIHEHGVYDLPAQLELVKELTGRKVLYVGFSMGCTAATIFGSLHPEKSLQLVEYMVAVAPAVIVDNLRFKYLYFIYYNVVNTLASWRNTPGYNYVKPMYSEWFLETICFRHPFLIQACQIWDMLAIGINYDQNIPEAIPIIARISHDVTSYKQPLHFVQLSINKKFQGFDHGSHKNLAIYGSSKPPEYNISKLKIPTFVITGSLDKLVFLKDAQIFYDSLSPKIRMREMYVPKVPFNHMDFLVGKDAKEFVYDVIVDFMKNN